MPNSGFEFLNTELETDNSPLIEINDEAGDIDYRYKLLSYSSSLILHGCPRKFQLYKLNAKLEAEVSENMDFTYGAAVGEGVQELLVTKNLDAAIFKLFLVWSMDLLAEDEKRNKSFAAAVAALIQLQSMLDDSFLQGYSVKYYNGKPATELGFKIELIDGFVSRGYIDIVLEHDLTKEIKVLEIKTDSGNYINHYKYKNSSQGLSYSVVLDKIAEEASSYTVQYLVQMTKLERYESFEFPKTYSQRAIYLRDLMYDVEHIKQYVANEGNYGLWPMRGEFCTNFGKVCPYMDVCHLDTKSLMTPLRKSHIEEEQNKKYEFHLTLQELLEQESE